MSDPKGLLGPKPKNKTARRTLIAVAAIIVVAILVLTFALSGFFSSEDPGALGRIKARHKMILATDASSIPFEFYDPVEARYEGFDIDLGKRIMENVSKEVGRSLTLDVRDIPFDSIPGSLDNDYVDISISRSVITGPWNGSVLFSIPYFTETESYGILVNGSGSNIASVQDLWNASAIAVIEGTTSQLWLQDVMVQDGYSSEKVSVFQTIDACLLAIQDGTSQAFIIDEETAKEYAEKSSGALKLAAVISGYQLSYGCAFNVESEDLKEIVDRVITNIIASGEMNELKEKWGLV